ncbi:hypothetical protein MMC10_002758 [Thelotrema lepadinum]|nr:hypothetical protein [Thelotrema lepadinum]
MASFATLPLELRREVYSYLLRDTNAYIESDITNCQSFSGHTTVFRPRYSTSLFTVSKQISAEALDYFYVENAFVAVKAPNVQALSTGRQLFPAVRWFSDDVKKSKKENCLTRMAMVARIMVYHAGETPPSPKNPYMAIVLSARNLKVLIRIINSSVSLLADGTHKVRIHLNFQLDNPYYAGKESIVTRILEPLKTFKSSPLSRGGPPLSFTVRGKIGEEYSARITAFKKPRHKPEDTLTDCEWAFRRGDEASAEGRYGLAENYYNLIQEFLVDRAPRAHEEDLFAQFEAVCIEKFLRMALNYSRAGRHVVACESLTQALAHEDSRPLGESAKEEKAYMWFTSGTVVLAAALADVDKRGNLRRAFSGFKNALKNIDEDAPERMDVQWKLDDVKVKLREIEGSGTDGDYACPDCGCTCGRAGWEDEDEDNGTTPGPGPPPGEDDDDDGEGDFMGALSDEMVAGLLAELGLPIDEMFGGPPSSDDSDFSDSEMPALE